MSVRDSNERKLGLLQMDSLLWVKLFFFFFYRRSIVVDNLRQEQDRFGAASYYKISESKTGCLESKTESQCRRVREV